MTLAAITPTWTPRHEPLSPAAVVATGAPVAALAADTALRVTGATSLRVLHAAGWLLVLGPADELPWADGVTYLGVESGLYVPTLEEPQPSSAFLATALPAAPVRVLLPGLVLSAPFPALPPNSDQLVGLP